MVRKSNGRLGIVLVLVLLSISFVSAITLTINSPATNGIFGGAFTTNVTIKGIVGSPADSYVNISYYMKSASTANSSWSLIGTNNSLNLTLLGNETIGAFDLSSAGNVEDSNDYIFNVTVYNDTDGGFIGQAVKTGIIVDYTEPTAPTSLNPSPNSLQESTVLTFSGTVVDKETTGCTLLFTGTNPGSGTYDMIYSGNLCSLQLSGISFLEHKFFIRATDGSNTTDSITSTFTFPDGGSGLETVADETDEVITVAKKGYGGLILLGVGIFIAWMVFKK